MAMGLQDAAPIVGAATSLDGDERRLTIDEELQHLIALELGALDLTGLRIHDMDLKHILGNVHSDDRQFCGTLHDPASSLDGDNESPLSHIDAVAARRRR